jgi:hypothetical protein
MDDKLRNFQEKNRENANFLVMTKLIAISFVSRAGTSQIKLSNKSLKLVCNTSEEKEKEHEIRRQISKGALY